MIPLWKSTKLKVKKFIRSNSPVGNHHQLDRQADRSTTPTHTLHTPTSDNSASRSKSVTPTTLVGTQAGTPDIKDDKKPVPMITVEESPTPLAPISTPSKKLIEVITTNAQHDLIVLHVAYILQKSTNLQSLILEILRLSKRPDLADIIQDCVSFTSRLIAALDSPTIAQTDVEQAIVMLIKTIEAVDWNARDKASCKIKGSIKEIEDAYPDILTIEQKKDSTFSKVRSKVLGVALPMLEIINTGSSMIPVPMVHPLIGVVAGFLQAADQACNNFEWMRWLSITAAECVIGIAVRCPEKTKKTEQTEQNEWTKAINTLQKKLSDIVQRAEYFCRRSVVSRFLQQGCDKGAIEMMKEDLKAAIRSFNVQVGVNIKLDLEKMSRKIDDLSLASLPHLKLSDCDSHDDRFQASREKEIEYTLGWIEDSDSMRFFWINGAAGVGKSTLARRLLDYTKEEGILATFAYFSLGNTIDTKDLVRGMARELSSLHPGCRPAVARAISECSGEHQNLDEYLTHFLVNPVASLAYGGSLVIILDALDEWVHRVRFLKALRNLPPTLSLKFVMTSRYLEDIASTVNDVAILYELTPVSDPVCRKYFEDRFNDPAWDGPNPDDDNLDKLVELAAGFLIWAATVCTLVSTPHPDKSPSKILEEILSSSLILGRKERMEDLYQEALKRIFPAEHKGSCLKLSLSMVVLREDVPLTEFSRLVNMEPKFIQDICRRLRALQTRGKFHDGTVQPAIKLFHVSFIEHLCRLNEAHGVMADNCIHFFKRVTEPDQPGPFPFQKAEQYIGKYWMYHLQEAPEKRSNFLNVPSNHLRLWVGCLLSHLFLLGDMYGYSPVSDALKGLSDDLASTEGILSTPEMLLCDRSTTEMVFVNLQNALVLGGIDYQNVKFYTDNPNDVQRWAHVLNGLAITSEQIQRLNAKPNINDLNVAIDILKNLNAYAPDIQEQPFLLDNLGHALHTRSRLSRSESVEDLTTAIVSLHMKARDLRQKDSHDYPISLGNLASTLLNRFKYGSHPDDLSQAISLLREVLELWPASHHLRSMSLSNFGNALFTQFEQEDSHDSPISLGNLASTLLDRFKYGSHPDDLSQAISLLRHHFRSMSFSNFGNASFTRFEQEGQLIGLDKAIWFPQSAVKSALSNHAGCSSSINVFSSLQHIDFQNIDQAMCHQKAINSTPFADYLSLRKGSGKSYSVHFKYSTSIIVTSDYHPITTPAARRIVQDFNRAILRDWKVHFDLEFFNNSPGKSDLGHFECTGDLQDIDWAILCYQKAVISTPSDHAGHPRFFISLGNLYLGRFRCTGDLQDIDRAILCHQKAIGSTPSDHADHPRFFISLGNLYLGRFERTGDLQDIDQAIFCHQKAIDSTPSSSRHADLFNNLGQSYRLRFQSTHHFPDIQNSITSYRQAAEANGSPSIRLESARLAAMLSFESDHDNTHCLLDFAFVIRLLSEVAGVEQSIHRRHANFRLQGHSYLVGSAVATALRFNKVDLALEWLEQGRSVVWTQSYGTHPTFKSIPSSYATLAEDRQLLKEIRGLPGFQDLLQPPKTTNLISSLPPDGSIIIFNFHNTRCDALALLAKMEEPLHIPLENFNLEQAEQLQKICKFNFENRAHPTRLWRNRPPMSSVLKELWCKVVQPILEALGYSLERPPNPSDRHRIWWCPTGPLAFLPLHAAGIYGSAHQPGSCISDFMISSYTPTVRSLQDKFIASSTSSQCTNLMLVNQPYAPGFPSIPSTRKETRALEVLMKGTTVNLLLLEECKATRESVKAGMKSHGWVHFSCHGVQDVDEPLMSDLCLHDGRLELLEIMKQQIPNADFAFLSASETSKGGDLFHLTAGMLAAGYRGVVGTMWRISDGHRPEFATEFYQYLLGENGLERLDSTRAAYALDYATRTIRDRLGENDSALLTWVPYVHFGY